MTMTELFETLADICECDVAEIKEEDSLQDIPNWDSLASLSVIAMAHSQFGVILSGNDLANCKTLGQFADLLGEKITS